MILNWNGKHHLQRFLPSVLATQYQPLRVVVADNASTDGSLAFLEESFPQVERLLLDRNHGFAKGYNEALKKVEAPIYVLLNSDVEVTPDWLSPLVEVLQSSTDIAAAAPKIRSFRHRELFEYAGAGGGWLDAYGYPFARGRIFDVCETDRHQYDSVAPVFWATGTALAIKSAAYHEVGGFDEFFFAHQEEIDLCWRLQLSGYRVMACPQSVVFHVGGGTLPRGHSRKTFLNFRNNQIMLAKNLSAGERWKIPFRMVLDLVSAFKGLLSGDAGYSLSIVKAHGAFLRWLFSGSRRWVPGRRQPLRTLPGVYRGNLVWQHFVLNRKAFSEIVERKNS